jgi:hypothetical protein
MPAAQLAKFKATVVKPELAQLDVVNRHYQMARENNPNSASDN